jgi:WD40 repeat protein
MMQFKSLLCCATFVAACSLAFDSPSQEKKEAADEKTIRALIQQLGDDSFEVREAADKRLAAMGEPALGLLEKAAAESKDAEVRTRAEQIMRVIASTLFTQVRQFEPHKNTTNQPWVTRLVIAPDGREAISVSADAVRCWDLVEGKSSHVFGERKGAYCWAMAISADGKKLITGCGGTQAHVFDLNIHKRVHQFLNHTGPVWGVALTADGKQAITGADDKSILVWDTATGKVLRSFEGVQDEIRCMAISPDGKTVACGHFSGVDKPGIVRFWDFETGKEIRSCAGHKLEIACVAFSPDGKSLVSTSFDKTLRLWDVATGKEMKVFQGHKARAEYAAFTRDGKRIVSCGNPNDPKLRLWDVASGKQLLETEDVRGGFFCVAALPDNRQCVSAGGDGTVRVWKWAR